MTNPKKNPKGIVRTCELCFLETKEFILAHIPRCSSIKYYVHPRCEMILNYLVSPRDQEYLNLNEASKIVRDNLKIRIR